MMRLLAIGLVAAMLGGLAMWTWQSFESGRTDLFAGDATEDETGVGVTPSGNLEVEGESVHEFGVMDQQKSGQHVFVVKNKGPGTLRLKLKAKTCGCTSVKFQGQELLVEGQGIVPVEIPEGESANLEVSWETRFRVGKFREAVNFYTSDPEERLLELFLEGEIKPSVELTHSTLRMPIMSDEPVSATFRISSAMHDNLKPEQLPSGNPLVSLSFTPLEETELRKMGLKAAYLGSVTVKPGLPIGPFFETVTFATNLADRPEIEIKVQGEVRGDVILWPETSVKFNLVRIDAGSEQSVNIKIRSESPVKVKVASVKLKLNNRLQEKSFLDVPEPVKTGNNMYRLDIKVPPGAPGGNFKAIVELETSHPTSKMIKIPVSGVVAR